MPTTKHLDSPSHMSAVLLWLTTVVGGSILTTVTATLFILGSLDINAIIRAGILCTMVALVFSTPALFALPLGISWALNGSTPPHRIGRLVILIGSLFGIAALLVAIFITDPGLLKSGVLWFAVCYLLVAIVAIYWLYADWIFRKQP
jgi:hypothetical protein